MDDNKDKNTDISSWENLLDSKKSENDSNPSDTRTTNSEVVLFVTGMTCTSCEVRIERALSRIEGVTRVMVSFKDSTAAVSFDPEKASESTLRDAVVALGYGIKETQKSFSIPQLLGIGALVAVFFLLLSQSGLFSLIPRIDKNASYWILLLTGILTSVHCVGMCGAINISQSLKLPKSGNPSKGSRFIPGILYNGGRVISYTVIGGIVGAIGSAVSFSKPVQAVIIVVTGFIMIVMGLNILGVFPFLKRFQPRLPRFFGDKLGRAIGGRGPFLVGLLNGLMPCGPLQSMQLYALGSGSAINGALSMFFFSLGTVPLLLGVSALSSVLTKKFALRMIKVSAILVFFLGAGMIIRGFSLSGIGVSPLSGKAGNVAEIRGDVQYVTTTLKSSAYEPITVYAGMPVKWTINAVEDEINGCNSPMTIPAYNITKELVPGANYLEFTPKAPGNITYTCWMGMITSRITVLDNPNGTPSVADADGIAGIDSSNVSQNSGAIPALPPDGSAVNVSAAIAVLGSGVQTIQTDLGAKGYTPLIVQKGIPVRWTFRADKAILTSCNYRFVIPDLGIRKELVAGDNLIEFTPAKEGVLPYTCWMNMMRSAIYVVADLGDQAAIATAKSQIASSPASTGGSCCSGDAAKTALNIDPKDLPLGIAQIGSGVQTVSTDLGPWGYTPIIVQKGIPVRWTIGADPKYLSNCNYRLVIPDLRMRKELVAGQNLIEFTPQNEGVLPFSCWMQMVQSAIFVLNDINDRASIDSIRKQWVDYATSGGSAGGGGGCCGG